MEFVSAERIDHSHGTDEVFGLEHFSIHADGFWKLTGPGVYMAMRGSGESLEVLYIGSAKNLLARISEPMHGSLREAFKFKDCRLLMTLCKSEKHARDVESMLISAYKPTLNIAGKSENGQMARALRDT
jgi:excinuclease UvrABC nuclease subunit